jgi:hypothetical protein
MRNVQNLKHFRTIDGATRRTAMRAHLAQHEQIDFRADPHALSFAQQCALADMAKAVSWRKGIASSLSLGLAFFVYLARDVTNGHAPRKYAQGAAPVVIRKARRSFFVPCEVSA